jgi:short-subunit dehydrogenase
MLVVITGASKGIGLELVKSFSQSEYMVIAVSRNIKTINDWIKKKSITNVLAIKADICKEKDRKKIFDLCKKLNMPLKSLVNNAGLLIKKSFAKTTEKDLIEMYQTNAFAPYLLIQKLVPLVVKSKVKFHIVNIASMGGVQGSVKFPELSGYASSKASICGMTECLAIELGENNIAVNALAIGAVNTEMLKNAFPGYKAPINPKEMASFIHDFAINSGNFMNGKIIPVSLSTP